MVRQTPKYLFFEDVTHDGKIGSMSHYDLKSKETSWKRDYLCRELTGIGVCLVDKPREGIPGRGGMTLAKKCGSISERGAMGTVAGVQETDHEGHQFVREEGCT